MGSDHSRGPIKDPLALQSLSDVKLERIKDKREVGINFSLKKFAPAENDGDNMLLASDLWADRDCAISTWLSIMSGTGTHAMSARGRVVSAARFFC